MGRDRETLTGPDPCHTTTLPHYTRAGEQARWASSSPLHSCLRTVSQRQQLKIEQGVITNGAGARPLGAWGRGAGSGGPCEKRRGNHMLECSSRVSQSRTRRWAGGSSMSCMCRNMEKAGWLEHRKGRLGCLGKRHYAWRGVCVCASVFSHGGNRGSRTKELAGRGRADGARCQGLPAPGLSHLDYEPAVRSGEHR